MAGTVTVGCRLSAGLILRNYEMVKDHEPVYGGGFKEVTRAKRVGSEVKINGNARRLGQDAPHDIRGGVGLTYGVDADFFAKWLEANKDEPYVKNGSIFAQPTERARTEIPAQAKDVSQLKTGLEPIDMDSLPPEFKGRVERSAAP